MTAEKKLESTKKPVRIANASTSKEIFFRIDIEPDSWKAPKYNGKVAYDVMHNYKNAVKLLMKKAYTGDIIYTPVEVEFKFYFEILKKKRTGDKKDYLYLENFMPCVHKKDCTNMQKLFEDCLQRIVLLNDKQVIKISSHKLWAETSYVEIRIRKCFEGDVQTEYEKKTGKGQLRKVWHNLEHAEARKRIKSIPTVTKIA
jgi:Holliday junction resolvase RusA-like endonuclease